MFYYKYGLETIVKIPDKTVISKLCQRCRRRRFSPRVFVCMDTDFGRSQWEGIFLYSASIQPEYRNIPFHRERPKSVSIQTKNSQTESPTSAPLTQLRNNSFIWYFNYCFQPILVIKHGKYFFFWLN